ncbi:unnamed protein product [Parajaminaea phylloscopi]
MCSSAGSLQPDQTSRATRLLHAEVPAAANCPSSHRHEGAAAGTEEDPHVRRKTSENTPQRRVSHQHYVKQLVDAPNVH